MSITKEVTTGFNIAQIITLEEHTLNMMGFPQQVERWGTRLKR